MQRKVSFELLIKRILFVFLLIFEMCSLRLCAEDVTPAKAQVMREAFVSEVKKYVGCPYQYGAVGPDSFDCSGLIYFTARESLKIQLPRTAKAIYNYCKIVPDKEREIGDLLFFKTTSADVISHVGIYIGNYQFISAISDGVNAGVVVSSLKQEYWKPRYVCTGKFLKEGIPSEETENSSINKSESVSFKGSSFRKSDGSFAENIIFDGAAFFDWSLFAPKSLKFRFRGIDLQLNARFSKWILEPGIGLDFRINTSQKLFQIPVLFSATVNDYFRFYAGPVFSFSEGILVNSEKKIKGSIFPGIIGVSFSTPMIKAGETRIQFVQDVSYTIFNNLDNSALSFVESVCSGFVMYSGIRVSFPLNIFLKGL